jgi:hypothetical protein
MTAPNQIAPGQIDERVSARDAPKKTDDERGH